MSYSSRFVNYWPQPSERESDVQNSPNTLSLSADRQADDTWRFIINDPWVRG